jgi:non-specific serine/threonine protein kinase
LTPVLSIQLLGQFRIAAAGSPDVTAMGVRSQRLQALLAYLVLQRQAPLMRQHLAFLLWPVSTEAQALTNLRNLLHQLRQVLPAPEQYFDADSRTLQWRAAAPATVDVIEFEAALARATVLRETGDTPGAIAALRAAESCYGNDLLPACYDDGLAPERERLRLAFVQGLETLVLLLAASGEAAAAVPYAQRLVRHDPLHEDGYRHLVDLYAATGDRIAALRTYQTCRAVLQRELDTSPGPATELAFQRSQATQLSAAPGPAATPPAPPLDELPVVLTRFIGRGDDVAMLRQALSGTRLLTLTGPGGSGKTRLALQVAGQMRSAPELRGRLWWVDLAPVADPELVGSAWLSGLRVERVNDQPDEGLLVRHIGPEPALVITDNCEHVVDACALLTAQLLAQCPGLTVLATSRELLGVAGEVVWPVRPLALPDRHWRPSAKAARLPDAVALFADRAAAVLPTFALAESNGAAIAAICRRVDGLPLAIELAASAVRVMSVPDIARRLETTLDLPPARSRAVPDRHRTLEAAIGWSYGRLSAAEQALFRQLSVFAGGFSLAMAEALCADAGGPRPDLLGLLAQLVDKSMITVGERQGRAEYRLLESLRHYGRRQLDAEGEAATVHARHVAYCLSVVETGHPDVSVVKDQGWQKRVEAAEDDIRAALAWCATQGDEAAEALARLATAMLRYWRVRSQPREAQGWLNQVLARPNSVPPRLRARALRDAGAIASTFSQHDVAEANLRESLALYEALGDTAGQASALVVLAQRAYDRGTYREAQDLAADGLARAKAAGADKWPGHFLNILGLIEQARGNFAAARAIHTEALALRRAAGWRWEAAGSLICLAEVAVAQRDTATAHALCDEMAATFAELGDQWSLADVQQIRGRLALVEGDATAARQQLQAALAWRRQLGDPFGTAACLYDLALAESADNAPAAVTALREALVHFRHTRNALGLANCLELLAHLLSQAGDLGGALRLYGTVEAWREVAEAIPSAQVQAQRRAVIAAAAASGAEDGCATAWAEGRALSLDAAAEQALG